MGEGQADTIDDRLKGVIQDVRPVQTAHMLGRIRMHEDHVVGQTVVGVQNIAEVGGTLVRAQREVLHIDHLDGSPQMPVRNCRPSIHAGALPHDGQVDVWQRRACERGVHPVQLLPAIAQHQGEAWSATRGHGLALHPNPHALHSLLQRPLSRVLSLQPASLHAALEPQCVSRELVRSQGGRLQCNSLLHGHQGGLQRSRRAELEARIKVTQHPRIELDERGASATSRIVLHHKLPELCEVLAVATRIGWVRRAARTTRLVRVDLVPAFRVAFRSKLGRATVLESEALRPTAAPLLQRSCQQHASAAHGAADDDASNGGGSGGRKCRAAVRGAPSAAGAVKVAQQRGPENKSRSCASPHRRRWQHTRLPHAVPRMRAIAR
mmetsp:Transcript_107990/g.344781  ORF Transcript_107990/g.344781 Transcript_107990/m.344781 type:complete len:380 (+) Transcript_107990:476-1615(+)